MINEAIDQFVKLYACRVCKAEKEATGNKNPCPVIGGICTHMIKADEVMKTDLLKDRLLVKRGEIN